MRALLVDDHALFRDGMVLLLQGVVDEVTASHAGSLRQALDRLASEPPFDLVVFDLNLPGTPEESGLQGLSAILAQAGGAPTVVMSGEERPEIVRQCLDLGAHSFILKSSDTRVIAAALKLVLCGGRYVPPLALTVTQPPEAEDGRLVGLTPRQRDVLERLVQGKPNKTIARELGISDATVKTHVTAIMRHLGTASRAQTVHAMRDMKVPSAYDSPGLAGLGQQRATAAR